MARTSRAPRLAAITDRLLTLGWLSRTAGRGLRVVADYERYLDD